MLISWNITKECNLSCRHCYRNAGKKEPNELSLEEGKRLLLEIRDAGFKMVILSGGEPLLRNDVYQLIEYGIRLNLIISMGTNGTLLTSPVVARLKDSGLSRVGISLDSTNERLHNEFRQKDWAFKKTLNGIENCKRLSLPFQIHTTIMDFNYDEIEKIIDFSKGLSALAIHIFFPIQTGRLKGLEVDMPRYKKALELIFEKQKRTDIEIKPICAPQYILYNPSNKRGCLAGISYCCVAPQGDVYPCPYLPIKVGNVRDIPFNKIWENGGFKELRIFNYKGKCGICDYKLTCGGCRARSYSYNSDYLGEDPFCK